MNHKEKIEYDNRKFEAYQTPGIDEAIFIDDKKNRNGEKIKKHTNEGKISMVFGIIGAILIINWIDLLPNFPPLVLGIVAIVFGRLAKKDGDSYGKTGMTLGIIATILGGLQVIAWFIYVYITVNYF